MGVMKQMSGTFPLHVFWAQHVWDKDVGNDIGMKDWGKHNAETTFSWWGANDRWHPCLWGCAGACPATLSYHLEHTLFPGINYLQLPMVANIVRSTCAEFNVEYPRIWDLKDLQYQQIEMLRKYAVPSREAVIEDLTQVKSTLLECLCGRGNLFNPNLAIGVKAKDAMACWSKVKKAD